MEFELLCQDHAARRGRPRLLHGTWWKPAFMPVGTYGTVKGMTPEDVGVGRRDRARQHLPFWLRPGTDIIKAHGDLHDFMQWHGLILTDSGGFQVFSLAKLRKISEEGCGSTPVDGSPVFLDPETSMRIQRDLEFGHRHGV